MGVEPLEGQQMLPLWRAHDLPPAWDGARIRWDAWEATPVVLCPTSRKQLRCSACGSQEPASTARGVSVDRVPRMVLCAVRCPRCSQDQVWDSINDTWWDLDEADYDDVGSLERPRADLRRPWELGVSRVCGDGCGETAGAVRNADSNARHTMTPRGDET